MRGELQIQPYACTLELVSRLMSMRNLSAM